MELTHERLNKLLYYKDGKLFWKSAPSKRVKVNNEAGSLTVEGYIQIGIDKKMYSAHRLVFFLFNKYMPKIVDHKNRDITDNRIENLRDVSAVQSSYNRGLQSNNTSGTKGVTWNKKAKKWQVQLNINKKYNYFGCYEDKELAELVSIEATNKYHKEFSSYAY